MKQVIDIKANGAIASLSLGRFTHARISKANQPFQISFDGGSWQDAKQNDQWGPMNGSRVHFRALNGLAATVSLLYDTKPFTGQDTEQSVGETYALGNSGYPSTISGVAKALSGGADWASDGGLVCTNLAAGFKIPGVNNGHKRKQITFFNNFGGGTDYVVFDESGRMFARMKDNDPPLTYETSSTFYILGLSGVANKVYVNELYYAAA